MIDNINMLYYDKNYFIKIIIIRFSKNPKSIPRLPEKLICTLPFKLVTYVFILADCAIREKVNKKTIGAIYIYSYL